MARRRKKKSQFHEPSLVPLADMLTNTVGVMVFILIFTVLIAGGAVITKRLPMEHKGNQTSTEDYLCLDGRIYPFRDEVVNKFFEKLGTPERSLDGFRGFVTKANSSSNEDEFLTLTANAEVEDLGNGYRLSLEMVCTPKKDAGLGVSQLQTATGFFEQDLHRLDPKVTALIFWVKPNGIDVFRAARDTAESSGFSYNWKPRVQDKPLTFTLGGGSGNGIVLQN